MRECTYLPDSSARDWMRRHVLRRFRKYGFKVWEHRDDPSFEERLQEKFREGKQGLNQLRRANEGELKPLLKVLFMAYGRTGKRRHELMEGLMPTAPANEEASTALPDRRQASSRETEGGKGEDLAATSDMGGHTARKPSRPSAKEVNRGDWTAYVPDFTPPMRALLQSQIQNPPPHITRPNLRRMQPQLEEMNSWFRPMPRSRVKNQTKDWYANLLERVHPPLPMPEWQRLRDLASGKIKEPFVPRRKHVAPPRSALEAVAMYGKPDALRVFGNRDAHQITPRYMRRLWAKVFSQCPVMECDADTTRWKVTWGIRELHMSDATAAVPSKASKARVNNTDEGDDRALREG